MFSRSWIIISSIIILFYIHIMNWSQYGTDIHGGTGILFLYCHIWFDGRNTFQTSWDRQADERLGKLWNTFTNKDALRFTLSNTWLYEEDYYMSLFMTTATLQYQRLHLTIFSFCRSVLSTVASIQKKEVQVVWISCSCFNFRWSILLLLYQPSSEVCSWGPSWGKWKNIKESMFSLNLN